MRPEGTLLVDSGFWFALFDGRDQYHSAAQGKAELIDNARIAFPWPTLYETINTRFVKKNPVGMRRIDMLLKSSKAVLIDDVSYRDNALHVTIREPQNPLRPISLVDMVIRFILDDPNVRIDGLLTFNEADFADICLKRKIAIL
jgi:predicted nucleic acid-binding protein